MILFVMIFTVGTGYFLWVNQNNSVYDQALAARNNANLALQSESISVVATAPGGTLWFAAQNTGAVPVNMTNIFVVGSTGNVVCQKVLEQGPTPCPPGAQTAPIGAVINQGASQPTSVNTGYGPITAGATYTIKVLTQRGNVFSATYMGIAVATTLSATSIGAGSSVTDTAAISGGSNPQGSVSFFYSTTNTSTCSTATFTQVGGAGATFPVIDGSATSSSVAFNSAGQYYWWYATYMGDSNNPGGESSPCEPLTVVPAQPTLTTSASPPVMNIGSSASDTAYFSGGSPSLKGTAFFGLYPGVSCAGTPVFTDSEPVAGNGAVPSNQFTPASVGKYTWQASFTVSVTDTNDNSITAQCGGSGETLTVNAATPSIATLLSDTTITVGGSVYDTATLSSVTGNAGGTVQYSYFANGGCTGTPTSVGSPVAVTNGVVPKSGSQTFPTYGSYSWNAAYSGDLNNNPATSPCEPLTVQMVPVISTALLAPSIPLKGTVSDTATLSGATSGAGGTITFWWSLVNGCPTTGATLFSSVPVSGNGNYPSFPSQPLSTPGIYYVYAEYGGDANDAGVTSPCEPLTVGLAVTTSLSAETVTISQPVSDSATLHFATGNAGGTLTYSYFSGSSCGGTGTLVSTVTVTNGLVPNSAAVSFPLNGTYSWVAVYSGDSNNQGPITSPCEPLTVIPNTGGGGSGGSLGLVSESFRFYYTNCNPEGNTGSCPPGTGDGVSVGGYYGYGLSFNQLPACSGFLGCLLGVQPTAQPDVYQIQVTNTDPSRSITLSAQSFMLIQGTCSVSFLCSILSTAFSQGYFIVSGLTGSGGNGAVPLPYNSQVTIPPGVKATLYFYCTGGPCTSSVPTGPQNAPPAGESLVVSVGLFGIYSDGTPFAQTIPYVASYVSPVYITAVSPAQPTGSLWLSGLTGSTIQLTAANFPSQPPSVNVYWTNADGTTSLVTVAGSSNCPSTTCTVSFKIPASATPGQYYGIYVTSDGVNNAYATVLVQGGTTTTISCTPTSFGLGQTTPCIATVTGSSPTGTVSWSQTGGSGSVSFTPSTCTLSGGSCTVTVKGNAVGSPTIQASYGGDVNNGPSIGTISLTVGKSVTTTAVSCSGASCTATVTGFSGTVTGETITWSQSGAGSVTFSPGTTCALSAGGTCSITIKGTTAGAVTIQASYPGDANNLLSSGTTSLTIHTTTTAVACVPASFAIGATSSCTATLAGFSGTVTGETITWSLSGGTGAVSFSSGTCALSAGGTCSVTVTGTGVGSPIVTASYGGDAINLASSGTATLTVTKATTTTTVSCVGSTCTATVTGFSGTVTGETITWSQSGAGSVTFSPGTTCALSAGGTCSVTIAAHTAGSVTLQASYPGDANNLLSSGTTSLTIHTTTTTVACVPASFAIGASSSCTATLAGFSGTVTGETITWSQTGGSGTISFPSGTTCALAAGGTCSVTVTGTGVGSPIVTASYGGDAINLASSGTATLTVTKATTTIAVSCVPNSFNVGAASSCTATLSGFSGTVTGETITMSKIGGTGSVTFPSGTTCTLSAGGTCAVTVNGATAGPVTIQASYPGDANNLASIGSTSITVSTKATTTIAVSCVPASFGVGSTSSCTATLSGFTAPVTGETITMSQTGGTGTISFPSGTTCTLSAGGTCAVTVKGATAGSVTVQASYPGDANNLASTGTTSVTVTSKPALALDTTCEAFGSSTSSRTITTGSLTCQANDLIIVEVSMSDGGSGTPTVSSISGASLTWQQRAAVSVGGSVSQAVFEWYAVVGGSATGSFTITVTMSTASGVGTCQANRCYLVQAFGVIGANTATPFDAQSGLPFSNSGSSGGTPSVSGVSTSYPSDMIIGLEADGYNSVTETAGSGFTMIAPHVLGGGGNGESDNSEYKIVAATQSGITVTFGTSTGSGADWVMLVDAIQDPPVPGGAAQNIVGGAPSSAPSLNVGHPRPTNSSVGDIGPLALAGPDQSSHTSAIGIHTQLSSLVTMLSAPWVTMNVGFKGASNLNLNALSSLLKRGGFP